MLRITKRKVIKFIILPNVCVFTALAFYFPGAQLPIALTLATGIQRSALQAEIDACEEKAIHEHSFTVEEVAFLENLYTCLYKGARLTLILPEVSNMMEHYLSKSGEPLEIDASLFKDNDKVTKVMEAMKENILSSSSMRPAYRSESFYMPDSSNIDSVFGLYYGHLVAKPKRVDDRVHIDWRAEVPWDWPSYQSLEQKYGDPHSESFPIPNMSCLILGPSGAIYIDNGLGEYLVRLELAKPFVAYAEWSEVVENLE